MNNSSFPCSAPSWWITVVFLLLIVGLMALMPWLPALAAKDPYYGLRVDLPAQTLATSGADILVPPASGLAVVFFGYRHCGAICPVQMSNLLALQERLSGESVRFVFVTLDPERDSRGSLDNAMAAMGPAFEAVRPESANAARALARSYHDYATREGAGEVYDFNHTAHLHVVSSQGRRELVYTTPDLDLNRVTQDLRRLLLAREPGLEAKN